MLDTGKLRTHIKALQNGDDSSLRDALNALKNHEKQDWESISADAVRSIVEGLRNQLSKGSQPLLRQEVAAVLGNIGPRAEAAVPQLIELLQEGLHYRIRETAAIALGKIGKKARPAVGKLIDALPTSRPSVAIHLVRSLSEIGCTDQRVRTALGDLWLSPPSPEVQVQAAIAMCKLGIDANGLLKVLTKTLVSNPAHALRTAAAEALAWCDRNAPDVVPALLSAVHDKNEDVRRSAEAALAHMGLPREKAIRVCAKQLQTSPYAEAALRNCGLPAVPALREALGSNESIARETAARILGSLGEIAAEAAPELTALIRDKDTSVRLAAAKSLWNVTKKADLIVPVLVDLLRDKKVHAHEDGEARRRFLQTVIEALRRIGPAAHAAIPALNEKMRDKNRYVSESALSAVNEIAPAAARAGNMR
jgi:HEAT repeat protein